MTQRESQLLWLRDLIEHLREAHDQLDWTDDPETARLLLDNIEQDLECAKGVCASIRQRTPGRTPSLVRIG